MNKSSRLPIEQSIVKMALSDILQAGFMIGVYQSTGYAVSATNDADILFAAAQSRTACDLHVFECVGPQDEWKRIGFVKLAFGNAGWDVIEDHSISLAPALANADALSRRFKTAG